jgi:hypothetical protein
MSIDLNAIKERAKHAQGNPLRDLGVLTSHSQVIRQDVPALVAEVERLREKFSYFVDLALEFYDGETLSPDLEKYRDTVQEILVCSCDELEEEIIWQST